MLINHTVIHVQIWLTHLHVRLVIIITLSLKQRTDVRFILYLLARGQSIKHLICWEFMIEGRMGKKSWEIK